MFGLDELKQTIQITDTSVECPVKKCKIKVERQKNSFKRDEKFKCPLHNIYISPTTFEYEDEKDNLLWKNKNDLDLLNNIRKFKRECRFSRDNSEDAVSWNVFRFLEKNNLINEFLKNIDNKIDENKSEIIYWSFSQSQNKTWDMLLEGRKEFEIVPSKGSEPDLIILGEKNLIFIEAKFGSSNNTKPSNPERVEDKYISRGNKWWKKVFSSDFKTVAIEDEKYELARFWLIGSWIADIADRLNLNFYLINLTLTNYGGDIEKIFNKHIKTNNRRKFKQITWEQIYNFILKANCDSNDKEIIIKYFKNKSLGYRNGKLRPAFLIN